MSNTNPSRRFYTLGGRFRSYGTGRGSRDRASFAQQSRVSRAAWRPRSNHGAAKMILVVFASVDWFVEHTQRGTSTHHLSIALRPLSSPQPLDPSSALCGKNVSCFKPSYWVGRAGPETAAEGRIGAMHDACPPDHSRGPARSARSGALAVTDHSLSSSRTCSCMPTLHHGCTSHVETLLVSHPSPFVCGPQRFRGGMSNGSATSKSRMGNGKNVRRPVGDDGHMEALSIAFHDFAWKGDPI